MKVKSLDELRELPGGTQISFNGQKRVIFKTDTPLKVVQLAYRANPKQIGIDVIHLDNVAISNGVLSNKGAVTTFYYAEGSTGPYDIVTKLLGETA